MKVLTALLAFTVLLLAAGVQAEEDEKQVTIEQVPAAVKAAIETLAGTGTVKEIEEEKESGKVIYSVEIVQDGKEVEHEIGADGAVLKTEADDDDDDEKADEEEEQEIAIDALPQPVRAAFANVAGDATGQKATKEREGGIDVYEVEYTKNGKPASIEVTAEGAVLEIEREIDASEVPATVKAKVEKKFAGAEIKKVEEITPVLYEIKVVKNGKTKEVKINGAGKIVDDDDDENDD